LTNEKRYQETPRRFLTHAGLGAGLAAVGFFTGPVGLFWVLPFLGGLLVLSGGWGLARLLLGRSDYLILSDEDLSYVHPVRPQQSKKVALAEVSQVSMDTDKVRKVKELKVTVIMRDGTKWTFGERFMDSSLLSDFVQDLQERMSRRL